MNILSKIFEIKYKAIIKPVFFRFDPERVHDFISSVGERLGNSEAARRLLRSSLRYDDPILSSDVLGVKFSNPIGLSAGFDYDAHMAGVLSSVGFGFNTVGTVTARPYGGNPKPRLARLPKSRSLLVNKGFKSEGAPAVLARLSGKNLEGITLGISVGSTNTAEISTLKQAIDDYCETFTAFRGQPCVSYFELNISCPNTLASGNFLIPQNFTSLVREIAALAPDKPLFIKMPNEISEADLYKLTDIGLSSGIRGYIFSNLVKDRSNQALDRKEISAVADLRGNFSGLPTRLQSDRNILLARRRYGANIALIGCGGVFAAQDAYRKIRMGANLVQMVTGMIYEGPQVAGRINYELARLLRRDGFGHISEAVGADAK